MVATRLELGAVRKRKLYRAGNKDLAGRRQVGQSRGEVHGFADGGVSAGTAPDQPEFSMRPAEVTRRVVGKGLAKP